MAAKARIGVNALQAVYRMIFPWNILILRLIENFEFYFLETSGWIVGSSGKLYGVASGKFNNYLTLLFNFLIYMIKTQLFKPNFILFISFILNIL